MSLLDWFVEHQPDQTLRVGPVVFLSPRAARQAIDRAEAAGISVVRMQGYEVDDVIASPIPNQAVAPSTVALLDCEVPSGSSCGAARRALVGPWADHQPAAGRRHMIVLEFDDGSAPL